MAKYIVFLYLIFFSSSSFAADMKTVPTYPAEVLCPQGRYYSPSSKLCVRPFKPAGEVRLNAQAWNSTPSAKKREIISRLKTFDLLAENGKIVPDTKSPSPDELSRPVTPVDDSMMCYACRMAKAAASSSCASAGDTQAVANCEAAVHRTGHDCCYKFFDK